MSYGDQDTPEYVAEYQLPRRCTRCYYVIEHLGQTGNCPECGVVFDLQRPSTYTRKPPFVWWTYWFPGFVAGLVSGFVLYLLLITTFGYGWSAVIAVPLMIGVIVGYGTQAGAALTTVFAICASIGALFGLFSLNLFGVFCGIVMGVLALVPTALGALIGLVLRGHMKSSARYSQRWHLPLFMLVPVALAAMEGERLSLAIESTETITVIDVPPERAWEAIQFYEEVRHTPPLLLRLTPTLRPRYTRGVSKQVGDIKVCVYERGQLTKQITEVIPNRRLAFRVIEQKEIQTDGVRLVDGSFDFAPTPDGRGTIVTLTTRYEPLLAARQAFRPAESLAIHTLHGHVMRGMKETAEAANAH